MAKVETVVPLMPLTAALMNKRLKRLVAVAVGWYSIIVYRSTAAAATQGFATTGRFTK